MLEYVYGAYYNTNKPKLGSRNNDVILKIALNFAKWKIYTFPHFPTPFVTKYVKRIKKNQKGAEGKFYLLQNKTSRRSLPIKFKIFFPY